MWLGEQITDKGIGNGVSLIIFIGIVLRYPTYVAQTYSSAAQGGESLLNLVLYILIAVADHHRHRVHVSGPAPRAGAASTPRRRSQDVRRPLDLHSVAPQQRRRHLDHLRDLDPAAAAAGAVVVQPLDAAADWLHLVGPLEFPTNIPALSESLNVWFSPNGFLYNIAYFFLVVVFTFFYSSIVVNTRDIADNLKKTGSFIPGIRPGQPTVDYLNKILMRLTTAAAVYLGLLAVLPGALQRGLSVTTFYLGSTSLLIVVGVALDTITQIEARLAMRDYRGFIKR